MGVPIVTTFIPLIAISLVLGVVSIVTYTNMHEKQMKQSMENAISGVLTYLERNTAGPFFELATICRILANNVESQYDYHIGGAGDGKGASVAGALSNENANAQRQRPEPLAFCGAR